MLSILDFDNMLLFRRLIACLLMMRPSLGRYSEQPFEVEDSPRDLASPQRSWQTEQRHGRRIDYGLVYSAEQNY